MPHRRLLALLVTVGSLTACERAASQRLVPPDPIGKFVLTQTFTVDAGGKVTPAAPDKQRVAEFTDKAAAFESDSCRRTTYTTRVIDIDSLVRARYGVSATTLGYAPPPNHPFVTVLVCEDIAWSAPLGMLMWKNRSRDEFFVFQRGVALSFKRQ